MPAGCEKAKTPIHQRTNKPITFLMKKQRVKLHLFHISCTIAAILVLIAGCTSNPKKAASYTNQETYHIQVGQTVDIYIKDNSCCKNCWVNESSAIAVRHTKTEVVEKAPKDCEGCNTTYAWKFEGHTPGTDTIQIARFSAALDCEEYLADPSEGKVYTYIINVSP